MGVAGVDEALMPEDSFLTYALEAPTRYAPECMYWETGTDRWSESGCHVINSDGKTVQCACTHLSAAFVVSSNDENTVPDLVIVAATFDMIGALLLFSVAVFSKSIRTKPFGHAPVLAHYGMAVLATQFFFVLSIGLTRKESTSEGGRFFMGMMLHYLTLAVGAVSLHVLVFIFRAGYQRRYQAALATSRWTAPSAWIGPIFVVIIYILVALDEDNDNSSNDEVYGDSATNGRVSFIMGLDRRETAL